MLYNVYTCTCNVHGGVLIHVHTCIYDVYTHNTIKSDFTCVVCTAVSGLDMIDHIHMSTYMYIHVRTCMSTYIHCICHVHKCIYTIRVTVCNIVHRVMMSWVQAAVWVNTGSSCSPLPRALSSCLYTSSVRGRVERGI